MIEFGGVFILGDSYSTFEGYIPEGYATYYRPLKVDGTDVTRVEETWWHRVLTQTQSELAENCSFSGTTICHTGYEKSDCSHVSFAARMDERLENGFFATHPVDTVLIFGGTNDSWADSPVGELQYDGWTKETLYSVFPALCYLLHRTKTGLPNARVIVLLNTELKACFTENFKQACDHFGVELIVLKHIDKQNGHPTIAGMEQIADQVLHFLEK